MAAPSEKPGLTYKASGVDYGALDPFKRAAQEAARKTEDNVRRLNVLPASWTRGESAFCLQLPNGTVLAVVEEGLGTKNLLALDVVGDQAMVRKAHYCAGWDAVAMIAVDLLSVGALPMTFNQHLAVGASELLKDVAFTTAVTSGWFDACMTAKAAWTGGETPTLKGIIDPSTYVLSGSGTGIVREAKRHWITGNVSAGDVIVFLASTGIGANGLTLARKIMRERLPQGPQTRLLDGRTLIDALLTPTLIPVNFVEMCQDKGIPLHYLVPITGHGLSKVARKGPFCYRITQMPAVIPPEFELLRLAGGIAMKEAVSTWNYGFGVAVMVSPQVADDVVAVANACGITAWKGGFVENGAHSVVVEPLGLTLDPPNIRG